MKPFIIYVKLANLHASVRTIVFAENSAAATAVASQLFGKNTVASVSPTVLEEELAAIKPITPQKPVAPEKQRIKSLVDQARRLTDTAKRIRAQQAAQKANLKLATIKNKPSITNTSE